MVCEESAKVAQTVSSGCEFLEMFLALLATLENVCNSLSKVRGVGGLGGSDVGL